MSCNALIEDANRRAASAAADSLAASRGTSTSSGGPLADDANARAAQVRAPAAVDVTGAFLAAVACSRWLPNPISEIAQDAIRRNAIAAGVDRTAVDGADFDLAPDRSPAAMAFSRGFGTPLALSAGDAAANYAKNFEIAEKIVSAYLKSLAGPEHYMTRNEFARLKRSTDSDRLDTPFRQAAWLMAKTEETHAESGVYQVALRALLAPEHLPAGVAELIAQFEAPSAEGQLADTVALLRGTSTRGVETQPLAAAVSRLGFPDEVAALVCTLRH